ncbi:malectin domain-containing carbohydrate-binding protein [Cyclobacterium marinum]|uniref:Parallel beta-helix repeat containing protein n=1 Tax=Cyclobacterium marinum (strain ATCC 25205 / DSM 745 / LMG 13164 / NCIMB 1802) TaxID=880070 RepID=G0J230_CYCMS|nr:malectin domain-containing carbohydrate-binding protein [Cyclobacterium marinum]AEL24539.1 parallel beta-helix repeat containing protein [Cyclobacterium marinum DSM 745]
MKALLFSISFLIFLATPLSTIFAANYYVSQEKGNDNRSLTEAQNPATPWKSIDKVNSLFNYLKPGDAILFNRGETFYGTLHISASGSSSMPIKIGAYGSGAKPVITSLKTISGWKAIGNGIYESNSSINTNTVQVLLINGESHELGRYPNSENENEGYLNIDDVSGNYLLSSNELGGSSTWNGGEVVIKKNQWIIDTHQISSHSGNQIRYNGNISAYTAQKDYGFFIQNHIKTLDAFGEWYFNPSTKKINIYFGNSNPSSFKVEVSTLDNLLIKDYRDAYITIENINFKGANKSTIKLEGGNNIKINDSEINFSGENGILALEVVDLLVERNIVHNTYNNGMYLRYGNDNAIVRDNEITKTALIAGRTQNEDAAGIGIFAYGENILVQNNSIVNSGFNGIQFNGNYTVVKNNFVDTFCQIKGDGGGIYTFGGVQYQGYKGRKIEGNIVVNSIGSKGGTPDKGVNYKPLAEGIFLDDNSNNIEITGNTIGNTENSGLKMSNANNILVSNNTFFNSHSALTIGNSVIGEDTRNLNIVNNQFFAKTSDQNSYSIKTYKNDIESLGSFDKNYFFRPLGDEFSIENEYTKNSQKVAAIDNLEQWSSKFGKDKNSKSNSVEISTYTISKKIGSSLYANSSFDQNVSDVYCSNCKQQWEENSKTNGGALKVTGSGSSAVKIVLGQLKKDKTYLLKFNALANKVGNISTYLRYTGTPWEKLSAMTTFEINTSLNGFEVLVSPYADVDDVSLLITSTEENFSYWLDDLEFVEVEASFINPDEEILFEYNPTKNSKTIALPGEYVNAKLEKFSGKVTIPAYGSVVLIRIATEFDSEEKIEETKTPEIKLAIQEDISEITEGDDVTLNSEISNLDSHIEKVDFYCGLKLVGTCDELPYQAIITEIPAGENYVWATVTDKEGNVSTSTEIAFTVKNKVIEVDEKIPVDNVSEVATEGVYYHVGYNGTVTYEDLEFEAINKEFIKSTGVNVATKASGSDEVIFQTEMFNKNLKFEIPLENGVYNISTYHNEMYFGNDGKYERAGLRVFDISIEGNIVKKDFDIFLESKNQETELTFKSIEITDGVLDLELNASSNNSLISGIAIVPVGSAIIEIPSVEVPDSSDKPAGMAIHLNTSYKDAVTFQNTVFETGTDYIKTSKSNTSTNSSASNDKIFQAERYAATLDFLIPVENGTYTVKTYHNELYFGKGGSTARVGKRVFDIFLEDNLVMENFDIFSYNNNQQTILTFEGIKVVDGALDLSLIASSNNASISGISIIKESEEINQSTESEHLFFLNTGDNSNATLNGITYLAETSTERFYNDGTNSYKNEITNVGALFQTERSGKNLKYTIPVPNGTYTVFTMHHELWFGHAGSAAQAGKRVYDISIQGDVLKSDFDLFVENNNAPTMLSFENIIVTDGELILEMDAKVNNASISGIAIIGKAAKSTEIAANLRTAQESFNRGYKEMYNRGYKEMDIETEISSTDEIRIFPNPAKGRATLELNTEIGQGRVIIHNMNGQLVSHFDLESIKTSKNQFNVPLENLSQGIYLVSISNEQTIINKQRLIVNP